MNTPTLPKYNTLVARALVLLLIGERITHKDFQKQTASYRLSGPIERLRNRHGWIITTTEETSLTSDKTRRVATYGRYSIEPELLATLKDDMGERLTRFIDAVQRFERGGNHDKS